MLIACTVVICMAICIATTSIVFVGAVILYMIAKNVRRNRKGMNKQ